MLVSTVAAATTAIISVIISHINSKAQKTDSLLHSLDKNVAVLARDMEWVDAQPPQPRPRTPDHLPSHPPGLRSVPQPGDTEEPASG